MTAIREITLEQAERRRDELIPQVLKHYSTTAREIFAGGMCSQRGAVTAREEIVRVLDKEFVLSSGIMGQLLCMSREAATQIRKRIDNNPGREWKLQARVKVKCDKCGGSGQLEATEPRSDEAT
jgi:hypothetical protein